jgi:hypothetical protein
MIKKILLSVAIAYSFILSIGSAQAQGPFKDLAVGIEAGLTTGPGITVATSLSPNFKLKAGIDYLGGTFKTDFDIKPDGFVQNDQDRTIIPLTGKLSDPKLTFTNFKAIVDYYPMKNGLFSLSAGLYAGANSISLSGNIDNYANPNVVFDFEDIIIKPNSDGNFDGKIKLGNAIKPYFGLGLGRTIANSRLGFKFDLGLIYQGEYKFESKNVTTPVNLTAKTSSFTDDADIPSWILKCWPVIQFSLSYRIF